LPLLSSEMRSMFVHFGPQGPVVFLLMSAECGKRIRNILGMMEHCSGCYNPELDGNALGFAHFCYHLLITLSAALNYHKFTSLSL